jgi:arylsulfatase A-like enzyme
MKKKPHIVLFNPDQWRGDVVAHMGNQAAVTPTLDALASSEAVSFRNAFCQNPVCTPSRCSFMSGWYPHVHGHRTMHHMLHAKRDEPNLLRVLKENGYFVWWGGKNDLVPGQDGWAEHADVLFNPTAEDYTRWGRKGTGEERYDLGRGEAGNDRYYSFFYGKTLTDEEDRFWDRDYGMIQGAIDFIRQYDGSKPLFIYLPLLYPHPPYRVEEPWFSLIDRNGIPERIPAPEDWHGKPSILQGIHERQGMQGWTEERWRELRAVYYGMCARTDHQLGEVVDALRDKEYWDDTALFFFSDHGDFTGDYGLVEKTQNTFEDCLSRVPFLFKPPADIPCKPGVRDALVELVDFPATVYELTGIEPGYDHFGRSLLPLARGERDSHRDAVFCEGGRLRGETQAMELESRSAQSTEGEYWPRVGLQAIDEPPYHTKATMCRTRDFKYVMRLYEQDELYDLRSDPQEVHNVVDEPRYATPLVELKQRLLTWYMETCDVVPRKPDKRGF